MTGYERFMDRVLATEVARRCAGNQGELMDPGKAARMAQDQALKAAGAMYRAVLARTTRDLGFWLSLLHELDHVWGLVDDLEHAKVKNDVAHKLGRVWHPFELLLVSEALSAGSSWWPSGHYVSASAELEDGLLRLAFDESLVPAFPPGTELFLRRPGREVFACRAVVEVVRDRHDAVLARPGAGLLSLFNLPCVVEVRAVVEPVSDATILERTYWPVNTPERLIAFERQGLPGRLPAVGETVALEPLLDALVFGSMFDPGRSGPWFAVVRARGEHGGPLMQARVELQLNESPKPPAESASASWVCRMGFEEPAQPRCNRPTPARPVRARRRA